MGSSGVKVDWTSMKRVLQKSINEVEGLEAKEKVFLEKEESYLLRVKQLDEQEREMALYFAKKLEEMEMRKDELGLILKEISVRQKKLNEQETLVSGIFEKIRSQGNEVREVLGKRAADLDEKEEELKMLAKRIELKGKLFDLKEKKLEEELKIRSELLELTPKTNKKADCAGNSGEECGRTRDPAQSTIAARTCKRRRTSNSLRGGEPPKVNNLNS